MTGNLLAMLIKTYRDENGSLPAIPASPAKSNVPVYSS